MDSHPTRRLKAALRRSVAVSALLVLLIPSPAEARTYPAAVEEARDYALRKIGAAQFRCLDVLWQRESGWRPLAHNARSGAHGIPQAVPGSKMRSAGADWYDNPMTQVRWGLRYVRSRYGTACNALDHAYRMGWYMLALLAAAGVCFAVSAGLGYLLGRRGWL